MRTYYFLIFIIFVVLSGLNSCSDDDNGNDFVAKDPESAEKAVIDRFSDEAGTLMQRSQDASLPMPDEPVNFDEQSFITQSYGPNGQVVRYYNFDVQPMAPAPIYVLFKEGQETPVAGQLNIIDVIPGDNGYNDFWLMTKVTVPDDYVANAITSYDEIIDNGFTIKPTTVLVNCPVVPDGSTATERYGQAENSGLIRGWYKGKIVTYFTFEEKALNTTATGQIPLSPVYVTFNLNPDENDPDSGPPSGFVTEEGSNQTHNVIATIPTDETYSPFWVVNIYDNNDFEAVNDLESAQEANTLVTGAANVNCPVVFVE